ETDVDELVEMVVERAVVDADRLFEFFGTHIPAVDESIEDLVAGTVSDGGVHIEVFVKAKNTVFRQQVFRIVREVPTNGVRSVYRHPAFEYGWMTLSLCQANFSRK